MRITLKEAKSNARNLRIVKTGFGCWSISRDYRGKCLKTITHDSVSMDNYNSDPDERRRWGHPFLIGYRSLCSHIIRDNETFYSH